MPAAADDTADAADDSGRPAEIQAQLDAKEAAARADIARAATQGRKPLSFHPCVQGSAGGFPCHQVDLMAYLPPGEFGSSHPGSQYGGPGNDVWGWTDPVTGKEWVLLGMVDGSSFIDISDPKRPVVVAVLPRHATPTLWSDIKTYADHAFIVAEGANNGLQVFDLTRLRDIDYADAPVTVGADAHYAGFGNSHNLVINEQSGFAYPVGSGGAGNPCPSSLHMVDIRDPKNPTYAGCYNADGYTHDAQCVIYHGPDGRFEGREICFLANPNPRLQSRLTIVDVTDKSNPVMLSRTLQLAPYAYSHQGWLTEDHRYFLHNDESDNMPNRGPGRTRTRVFDVRNLTDVSVQAVHHSETRASAHNVYVRGRYVYLSNYFDGLRVADITKIDHPGTEYAPETPAIIDHQGIREVACFDTDPLRNDAPGFGGTWSNYPWFKNGIVAVSGFDGLWIVRTRLGDSAAFPSGATTSGPGGQGSGTSGGGSSGCLGERSGGGPGVPHPPGHED